MTFSDQEPSPMMINLDDPDLTARLLAADPVDMHALHGAADSSAAAELRDEIMRTTRVSARHRRLALTIAGAAAAAAVAVPLGLTFVQPSTGSAYAAPLVRFAESTPQLLLGADGWKVTDANGGDGGGEMDFAAGPAQLDVFWVAGASEKESDKIDMTALGHATIDGERAWVGTYGDNEYEAIWSVGDQAREARGSFADRADFLAVAQTLRRVSVDTWLGAMPAFVVDPGSRAAVVDQMLADIPQPQGFDESSLTQTGDVLDRYQLGAAVTGAVTCAWVHQWVTGDAAERSEASQAMATAHGWAILQEMKSQGDYPEVLWSYAEAINGHPTAMTPLDNLESSANQALGC
jgi:hypothetical protein